MVKKKTKLIKKSKKKTSNKKKKIKPKRKSSLKTVKRTIRRINNSYKKKKLKKPVKKNIKKKKLNEKNKVFKKLSQSTMLSHSLEGFYRQGKLNQDALNKLIKLKPDKIKLIKYYLNLVRLNRIIPKKNKLKTSKVINQVKKKLLKHNKSKQKKLNKL